MKHSNHLRKVTLWQGTTLVEISLVCHTLQKVVLTGLVLFMHLGSPNNLAELV